MNREMMARRVKAAWAKAVFVCGCARSVFLFLFTVLYSLILRVVCGVSGRVGDSLAHRLRVFQKSWRPVRQVLGGLAYGVATLWVLIVLGM